MRRPSSSGDLLADRRFGYAQDLLDAGEAEAAADLLQQVLELVPEWPPVWLALGDAYEQSGQINAAASAFRRALLLAPDDVLGAGPRLARLGETHATMTPGYVAALFDDYAERFDTHLVQALAYRGPAIIIEALQDVCRQQQRDFCFGPVLDLGCGTGLMAAVIQGQAQTIYGVDLSPRMVEKARETGLYTSVHCGELLAFLEAWTPASYDLALAADVLVYLGDLSPLMGAMQRVLAPAGLFAFTVQACDGARFQLGHDLRYHHSADYLRRTAQHHGLQVAHLAPCVTRQDAGQPVPGFVVVLTH